MDSFRLCQARAAKKALNTQTAHVKEHLRGPNRQELNVSRGDIFRNAAAFFWRSGHRPEPTAGIRLVTPNPSSTVRNWLAPSRCSVSTLPEGQRIVTSSTRVAVPRPKCVRGSLTDKKLLLARTSCTCVRPPALTSIRAPKPSRFEPFPTVFMAIQWTEEGGLAVRLHSRTGEPSSCVTTTSRKPLFSKSPTANPRCTAGRRSASPVSNPTSAKRPNWL